MLVSESYNCVKHEILSKTNINIITTITMSRDDQPQAKFTTITNKSTISTKTKCLAIELL